MLVHEGSSVLFTGIRGSSVVTFLHLAVSKSSAITFLNELWRSDKYPPILLINERIIKLSLPHAHYLAASFIPKVLVETVSEQM